MVINAVVLHLSVVLIATALVAFADVVHAAVVPPHACQTAIEMSSAVDLKWTPEDLRRFRHEAERAWTALGVDVCWRDARTPCDHAGVTLYVRVAEDVPSAGPSTRRALGWIGFSDVAGPGPFIVLSVRRAIEMLGRAELAARKLAELPGMVAAAAASSARTRAGARARTLFSGAARPQPCRSDARGISP